MELRTLAADAQPVSWIVERLAELWGGELSWQLDAAENPPEAGHLALDSGAAERLLAWRPALFAAGRARAGRRLAPRPPRRGRHAGREPGADRQARQLDRVAPSGRQVVEFAHPAGLHNLPGVSPLSLRRHRAERLLREEFEGLQGPRAGERSRAAASERGEPRPGRSRGVLRDRVAGPLHGGAGRTGDRQPRRLARAGDVPPRDRRAPRSRAGRLRRRACAGGLERLARDRRHGDTERERHRARLRRRARRSHAPAPAVRGTARDAWTDASGRPPRCATCRASRARRRPRGWASARRACAS